MSDLREQLLRHRIEEADVELDVGTVRVRGLSRGELYLLSKCGHEDGTAQYEAHLLARAIVNPEMTREDIEQWQRHAPGGELGDVVEEVRRLSGIGDKSAKEAYKSVLDEPGDGVRILPSAEAFDDGLPAPGGNDV